MSIIYFPNKLLFQDTDPSEYSVSHGCEHHFMWLTREACPIQKTLTNNDTCRVTNPDTGE